MRDHPLRTLRPALIDLLKTIKANNGYNTTLPDENVFDRFITQAVNNKMDASYPRCFVLADMGENEYHIAGEVHQLLSFTLVFMTKSINGVDDPQALVENFIDDVERAFTTNPTLQDMANEVRVGQFRVDTGATDPEGIGLISILITRCGSFAF